MNRTPTHFTAHEGGNWLPWTDGEVELPVHGETRGTVTLNGRTVHSLLFNNLGHTMRWDCWNGHTGPVPDR